MNHKYLQQFVWIMVIFLSSCNYQKSIQSFSEMQDNLYPKKNYISSTNLAASQNIKELEKSLEYHLGFKMIIEKKLSNDKFVNNAPENVIQNERKKLEDVLEKIRLIKETLKNHTN